MQKGRELGKQHRVARYPIALVAFSQLVSYGSLHYSFGAVLPLMSEELDLSVHVASSAFSAGLLSSAFASVGVGLLLDRIGARQVLMIGSVIGSVALVGWAHVHTYPLLLVAWIAIGVAGSFVFYETAFFIAMQERTAETRRRAVSTITIVGGLASTVYIPLVGSVAQSVGWRIAVLGTAAVFCLTFTPLAFLFGRPDAHGSHSAFPSMNEGRVSDLTRALVVVSTAAPSVVAGAVAAYYVALLMELEHDMSSALLVAGLLGLAATSVRFLARRFLGRASTLTHTLFFGYLAQAAALGALALWGSNLQVAAAATIIIGGVLGLGSLARPLLVARYLGRVRFGTISGWVACVSAVTRAGGPPLLGAGAVVLGGLPAAVPILIVFLAVAIVAVLLLRRIRSADGDL